MTTQTIKASIDINAPKEKVWEVLLGHKYIQIWYTAFGEGITADTDWQLGSKAVFVDNKGSGMIGKIVQHIPNEMIDIEYEGIMVDGKEDYNSIAANDMKGTHETYCLSSKDHATNLSIECEMDDAYYEMMSSAWEKALQKIKQLSESN